jgi:RNA polymerase sigma-70 factor (ECF subfamily)
MDNGKGLPDRMASMLDTHDLIVRSKEGDPGAFRQLVEYYQGYAYALAARLLADEDDARDVVQESFIRVWKHLVKYDPRARFTTWLYRIVTNLSYDRIKANTRRARVIAPGSDEVIASAPDPVRSTEQDVQTEQTLNEINDLAGDLPPRQRIVFVLRDLHDLSIREVSEITGIPSGSVKTNLYHARQAIRGRLTKARTREGQHDEMPIR